MRLSVAGTGGRLTAALTAGMLVLGLVLLGQCLRWPMIHNAALMNYIGWRVLEGAVPYRDLLDMNFPGSYLAHMAVMSLPFAPVTASAVGNVLLLLATGTFVGLLADRALRSRRAGLCAGVLGIAAIAKLGPLHSLERDTFALAFALAGLYLGLRGAERERYRRAVKVLSGAAFGFAITVKPYIGLVPLLCVPILIAKEGARKPRALLGTAVCFTGGAALAVGAVTLWLYLAGGLAAFVDFTLHYTFPLYQKLGDVWLGNDESPSLLRRAFRVVAVDVSNGGVDFYVRLGALVVAAVILVDSARRREWGTRAVLAAACLAATLHFVAQGTGLPYHAIPALATSVLLLWVEGIRGVRGSGAAVSRGRCWTRGLVLALAAWTMVTAFRGAFVASPWAEAKARGTTELAERLARYTAEGKVVQVFDNVVVGPGALLRSHLKLPSAMLYDFMLFAPDLAPDLATPYSLAVRARLLAEILAAKPDVLVVSKLAVPRGNLFRLQGIAELRALLDGYELRANEELYVTWEKKRGD